MDNSCPIAIRLLGGLAGLLGGTVFGLLILILAMILTGSYFGLNSVLPGAALGALGFVLGCCFPKLGMKLARLLSEM